MTGPAPASRRKQLMENEVLEHATRLFAERGFAGTSLQDVAGSMGLKRPALYYYFKSKDEVLDRLIVEETNGPAEDLKAIGERADPDAAERLHTMAHWLVHWIVSHRERILLLVKSESDLSPDSTEKFRNGRRTTFEAVRPVIADGIASGEFQPVEPHIATFGVLGICNWAASWQSRPARQIHRKGLRRGRPTLSDLSQTARFPHVIAGSALA
ncbi:TetR/AcrR family transcriptional regulator [Amycolatopsis sp. NPDC051061]|uniref:TetR/AcrR family transcriptional regulator n=1 Tax=Amycolatopsis sp. NPDC051061 TaxID=3155042 RepID=UPI00341C4670